MVLPSQHINLCFLTSAAGSTPYPVTHNPCLQPPFSPSKLISKVSLSLLDRGSLIQHPVVEMPVQITSSFPQIKFLKALIIS